MVNRLPPSSVDVHVILIYKQKCLPYLLNALSRTTCLPKASCAPGYLEKHLALLKSHLQIFHFILIFIISLSSTYVVLLCAQYVPSSLQISPHSNPPNGPTRKVLTCYYVHFTDEKTEAQTARTFPKGGRQETKQPTIHMQGQHPCLPVRNASRRPSTVR